MGGWYLAYGPQLVWKGLEPRDLEVLAKSVAAQTYDLKGLNGVMHFNPVPFWCAQQIANIPPMAHKGNRVTQFLKHFLQIKKLLPLSLVFFVDSALKS